MTPCDRGSEAAERYVTGATDEPERTDFEEHFFACDVCFRTVQALTDARHLLAGDATTGTSSQAGANAGLGRGLPLRWMAVAATLVISAGLSVLVWQVSKPIYDLDTQPAVEVPAAPPQAATPAAPTPRTPGAEPMPAGTPAPASTEDRLARLAAVTPPQYLALTTRSEHDLDAQAFDAAMAHYSANRHRQAADGLRVLADRAPTAAHVHFFLGISELMSGNVARARVALERSVDAGVGPYSDEAHFYLAKVALGAGDLTTAARELEIAVDREAGPDGDAARLLAELRRGGK
jgi:TolA-binding protein